jgi:hypothetical protein
MIKAEEVDRIHSAAAESRAPELLGGVVGREVSSWWRGRGLTYETGHDRPVS